MGAVIAALFVLGGVLLLTSSETGTSIGGSVFGVGTGVLALTLGMRHAFDADHISAIDNTTRKLIADGQRPVGVGFFFSLGHSTIVFALALLLNLGVRSLDSQVSDHTSTLHQVTGIIGTTVSGVFLYVIAALNVAVMLSILATFRRARRGRFDEADLEIQLARRGFMNRIFGGVGRGIDRSWKIYPIGVLFGLGFDTATEIALLVLSGSAVASGLPFTAVLSLPLLFAAGMCLFDTADGLFMNAAYRWAFAQPGRRIYYNIVVTALSVFVAIAIGSVELLGLLGSQLSLHGPFWTTLENANLNTIGYIIVGVFIVVWVVALLLWKALRLDRRLTLIPNTPE